MRKEEHKSHDSTKAPIVGCQWCDREINRPIIRRHGLGSSLAIVPQPKPEPKDV